MRPRTPKRCFAATGLALAATWTRESSEQGRSTLQQATRSMIKVVEETPSPPPLGTRIRPASVLSLCAVAALFCVIGTAAASLFHPLLTTARNAVQVYLVATKATLFPDSVRWKKTYLPLELLFAALLVCNAVLELLLFPNSKRSRMMRGTMHDRERKFFARPRAFPLRTYFWTPFPFASNPSCCSDRITDLYCNRV